MPHFLDYDPADIDVRVAQFITATPDRTDPLTHPKVSAALRVLRDQLSMDVAFVSEFSGGRRTYRVVETTTHNTKVVAGHSDPLEESWCQLVVEGRIDGFQRDAKEAVRAGRAPAIGEKVGTFLSTPIRLRNGQVYGTLCCFSQDVVEGVSAFDLRKLQITAQVLADDLHRGGLGHELELAAN